ncbi:hypothetical protein S245_021608, partial [Arachis hypogaea]
NSPKSYNLIVEHLVWATGFYQLALVTVLVERWHPDTHIFHFSVGECAVTLEDMALILGLPINGLPMTETTITSQEDMKAECLHQFGVAPST